jgi:DNA (cytosine-5)-methyltransferase 1
MMIEVHFDKMTHVSLFTGIGGIDLAAEWAGFEIVLQVERDPFCLEVLRKHWPDVPKIIDVRDIDGIRGAIKDNPITLISGGYPCQPHSLAGRKKGESDERFLWPAMFRIICEVKPLWVLVENVFGTISDGTASKAMDDLETKGYETAALVFSAHAFGANFRGIRAFLVSTANGEHGEARLGILKNGEKSVQKRDGRAAFDDLRVQAASRNHRGGNGIPDYMDRVRALGNAVVPQQCYPILAAIAEMEGAK